MRNKLVGARGWGYRRGGLPRGRGEFEGIVVLYFYSNGGYMAVCVSQNSEWYIKKRMNFTVCKWYFITKMKCQWQKCFFTANLCFQSSCARSIWFLCSEYKQWQHAWVHVYLKRNVGRIIDLNSPDCCLKVEIIKSYLTNSNLKKKNWFHARALTLLSG